MLFKIINILVNKTDYHRGGEACTGIWRKESTLDKHANATSSQKQLTAGRNRRPLVPVWMPDTNHRPSLCRERKILFVILRNFCRLFTGLRFSCSTQLHYVRVAAIFTQLLICCFCSIVTGWLWSAVVTGWVTTRSFVQKIRPEVVCLIARPPGNPCHVIEVGGDNKKTPTNKMTQQRKHSLFLSWSVCLFVCSSGEGKWSLFGLHISLTF